MPGPVSDSYDPVWGTGENAQIVRDGIREVEQLLSAMIEAPPEYILDVIRRKDGPVDEYKLTIRQLRILRYACRVALEEEDI